MNGEVITITVDVANTGDVEGSYTAVLKINGIVETSREITLDADATQHVSFSITRNVADTYTVDINGLTASFTVRAEEAPSTSTPVIPFNWSLIVGIIAGVIIVTGLLVFLLVRKKAGREILRRKINLMWVKLGGILSGVIILSLFLSRRGSKLAELLRRKMRLIWSKLAGILSRRSKSE